MTYDRVYVKNLADKEQVKSAERKEKDRRRQEVEDLKEILSTKSGRRFIWRLLEHCKVFESIWHPSALIHYNAGKQDVGHFIMAEIISADTSAFQKMMEENCELSVDIGRLQQKGGEKR